MWDGGGHPREFLIMTWNANYDLPLAKKWQDFEYIYYDQVERSSHRNDSLVTRLDETLACLSHCEAKARRKDDLIRRTVDSLLQSEGENQW